MFFVTHNGTFLCLSSTHRILQCSANEVTDLSQLLEINVPFEDEGKRFHRVMTGDCNASAVVVTTGPLAGYVIHLLSDRRTAAISNNGMFFCAVPGGTDLDCDRSSINRWETFACLTRQDVLDVLHILKHEWIVGSAARVVPRVEVKLAVDYQLCIGVIALDLRYNLPFLDATRGASPTQHEIQDAKSDDLSLLTVVLLLDGWRVEQIFLYNPMIFFTVFKSPQYIEQAVLCITSLLRFGGYKGDVHIISDRSREEFVAALPTIDPAHLSVQTVNASDWIGYVASKYCLLDWRDAHKHQPLLFLDTDVIVDADVAPLLAAIAISPRILAPMEDFSRLSHNPSVGASLIQRAGGSPRFARGFNGGTIGIPNLRTHGASLRLIRTIIANHIELHGRNEFRWVDQEVANYVSFSIANFDTYTMLRYVRFGWENCEHDSTRRIGLVHFFPPRGPMSKNEAMRVYVETLKAADSSLEQLATCPDHPTIEQAIPKTGP